MSQQPVSTSETKTSVKNGLTSGIILVGIGVALLLFQIIDLAMYIPLLVGVIFLAAGIFTRKAGLLVPGGIIGGVGLGVLSTQSAWFYPTNSVESGAVFLLLFSLGWFAITILSKIFTSESNTWALIPGAIMAGIGGLILLGEQGLRILELAGRYWPVILVIIGLRILWNWWKERK